MLQDKRSDDFNPDDFNWNKLRATSEIQHLHVIDFVVTGKDGQMKPFLSETDSADFDVLVGTVVARTDPSASKARQLAVQNYYFDRGMKDDQDGDASTCGFWLYGEDPDIKCKLMRPSPRYQDQQLVADQICAKGGLKPYMFCPDGFSCLNMTDFSLSDLVLDTAQTLILPSASTKWFALRGKVELVDPAAHPHLPPQLAVQTYVQSRYAVELVGEPAQQLSPSAVFCLEDCHGDWFRLCGSCSAEYSADYANTLRRSAGDLAAYNWPAEEDGLVWRHLTNFRLTTLAGEPHHLEIGSSGKQFLLWGDLVPPPRSARPPIPVKLRAVTHSIDIGRGLHDPERGVWMEDCWEHWYRLEEPAAEYRGIAQVLQGKAASFLQFVGALLFQDRSEEISRYVAERRQYVCNWSVQAVLQVSNPKFDLYFIQENKRFVREHLGLLFDLDASCLLTYSIDTLKGVPAPPKARAPAVQPAQAGIRGRTEDKAKPAALSSEDSLDEGPLATRSKSPKAGAGLQVKSGPASKPILKRSRSGEEDEEGGDEAPVAVRRAVEASRAPQDQPHLEPGPVPAAASRGDLAPSQKRFDSSAHAWPQLQTQTQPQQPEPLPLGVPRQQSWQVQPQGDGKVASDHRGVGPGDHFTSWSQHQPHSIPPLPPPLGPSGGNFSAAHDPRQGQQVFQGDWRVSAPVPPPGRWESSTAQRPPAPPGPPPPHLRDREGSSFNGDGARIGEDPGWRGHTGASGPPLMMRERPRSPGSSRSPPRRERSWSPRPGAASERRFADAAAEAHRGGSISSAPRSLEDPQHAPDARDAMPVSSAREPAAKKRNRFDFTPDADPIPPRAPPPRAPPAYSAPPPPKPQPQCPPSAVNGPTERAGESGRGRGRGIDATLPAWMTSAAQPQQSLTTDAAAVAAAPRSILKKTSMFDVVDLSAEADNEGPPVAVVPSQRLPLEPRSMPTSAAAPSGRGMSMTLPAWMTSAQQQPLVHPAPPPPPPPSPSLPAAVVPPAKTDGSAGQQRPREWEGSVGRRKSRFDDLGADAAKVRDDNGARSLRSLEDDLSVPPRGLTNSSSRSAVSEPSGDAWCSAGVRAAGGWDTQHAGQPHANEQEGSDFRKRSRFDDPDADCAAAQHADDSAWKAAARRQMDEIERARPVPQPQSRPQPQSQPQHTPPAEVPCNFCRGRFKKDRCTNRAHKDGCLISMSALNSNLVRKQLEASGALRAAPERALSDRRLGIDTAQANEAAAEALLGVFSPSPAGSTIDHAQMAGVPNSRSASGAPAAEAVEHVQDPAPTPTTDEPSVSAGIAGPKRDDISVERARYASKHNQPHQDGSSGSSNGGDGRAIIYSQKSGVWGSLKALPPAARRSSSGGSGGEGGAPVELIRLGEREDDPRKRLEQTRRNSMGAFAHSAALEAAKQRHSPPSASMRPAKSALKNGGDRDRAGGSSSSLEDGEVTNTSASASDAPAAPRPVKWVDMTGQFLCTHYTYEGAYDSPADVAAGSGLTVH